MLSFAPSVLAQNLHGTNTRLRFWLDGLIPDHARAAVATPEQMAGLLSELMRAGQWLKTMPRDKDPDVQRELAEYRNNVERLRELLPSIHAALLQERARLERDRTRVGAVAQWAHASRQAL
jgi:hypothetical protein